MRSRPPAFAFLGMCCILCVTGAMASRPAPRGAMAEGAVRFLEALGPDLRAKAVLPFDGMARTDWHFVPRTRPGLTFGEMNDAQRAAAHALLRSALSSAGYLKVTGIVELEGVLRDIESNPGRDAGKYTIAIYGDPAGAGPWGWKVEGHHLSLNFTSTTREVVATTPSFLGAQPAEVKSGPRAGWRVLAAEEDLARALVKGLSAEQATQAVISTTAPADIVLAPGRDVERLEPAGLTWTAMTQDQRDLLWRLVREYAETLEHDLASAQLARITQAGVEKISFAWAGGLESGQGHYYRIQGPTFVIEYDNTQNNANHVHTVWHDRERDFGRDLLGEHYRGRH